MRKNLKITDLGDLLEQPILAVLATHRRDGSVLLSPVWFEWLDGGFSIVTWANDFKSRSLKKDPRASVLVAGAEPPYPGIEVCGEAAVTSVPNLLANVARMARRYLGEKRGVAYAAAYASVDLELIRLQPGSVRAWDFADDMADIDVV